MALFDGIPAAIQAYRDALDLLSEEEQYTNGFRMLWEAQLGLVYDFTDWQNGYVPMVLGDALIFTNPGAGGLGDMTKGVYDTNDDGRVDAADHATAADNATTAGSAATAGDADTVDGQHAADFEATGAAAAAVAAHDLAFAHANLPSAGEKAALPGTSGVPGAGNKYVTDGDARNSDPRTPTAHAGTHATGQPDAVAPGDIGAEVAGAAAGAVGTHEGTYDHTDLPTADEKAALAGTSGAPSAANEYVTDADARNSDARTPVAHTHGGGDITSQVADAASADVALAVAWAAITGKPAVLGGDLVFPLATGQLVTHDVGAPLAHGARPFNAGAYASGVWTFRMVGWTAGPTSPITARARLYNLTDNEYVTGADVTTTAASATEVESAALTLGSAAGDLQDTEKIYEVRLEITGGVWNTDTAHFGSVELVRT